MASKKRILKIALISIGIIVIIMGGVAFYMFNKPARDIQSSKTDFSFNASDIVTEYLADYEKANDKYLDEEGNSKILEISGIVSKISEDFKGQKVILLKGDADKAGVSCTFTSESNEHASSLTLGDKVTIKGVIRSGASFDEDLGMYENVIVEKCDLVSDS